MQLRISAAWLQVSTLEISEIVMSARMWVGCSQLWKSTMGRVISWCGLIRTTKRAVKFSPKLCGRPTRMVPYRGS